MDSTTTTTTTTLNHTLDLDSDVVQVKTQLQLYDILIPTLSGIIILINLLIVFSSGLILKNGPKPKSTYLFLGNLAMADLITGIAVVFGQVYPTSKRDYYICAFEIGMIVSSTLASIYSVGLIGIDRFLYIVHGVKYQQWVYVNRARLLIVCTWIIGFSIGFLPTMLGWHGDTNNGKYCWFILLAPKELMLLTVIIGVVPIILVVVLYSIILYYAWHKTIKFDNSQSALYKFKNIRKFQGRTFPETQPVDSNEKKTKHLWMKIFQKPALNCQQISGHDSHCRAVKIVAFTVTSFIVTWSPYFIASLMYVYQCENNDLKWCKSLSVIIASPLAILGFTNSLINPIIYAWWHKGFREFVHRRFSTVQRRVSNVSRRLSTVIFRQRPSVLVAKPNEKNTDARQTDANFN